ncbi:MAG: hypothetical protein KTR31_39640 [Myxococcales bacterium]|nr:hypothetical protein [Myxococcales bacterium]
MGIRVRKLARELRCTAGDVLGLLQQLGYERYRSPEDMVSDVVAAKIRRASATPVPAPHRALDPGRRPAAPPPAANQDDVMASLVPGVVPRAQREWEKPPGPGLSAPAEAELASQRAAIREQAGALQSERAELASMRDALERERAELQAAQEALRAEREALATKVPEAPPEPSSEEPDASELPSAESVFEARGLRGTDEAERALAALAGARALGKHLESMRLSDPEGWAQLLQERLVLVGGAEPPAGLELPHVVVSPERADVPGARECARAVRALGEQLMLSGWVRATVAGMPPRWVPIVREGVDRRIELTFRPGVPTESIEGGVLLLWTHGGNWEASLTELREAGVRVFESDADTLAVWLSEIRTALEEPS